MPKLLRKIHPPRQLKFQAQLSVVQLAVFIVAFGAIGFFVIRSFAASTPSMYLAPASQILGPGSSFSVVIRENSGSTGVNAAQANLSYPASSLQFVSVTGSSAFSNVAQATGGNGTISFAAGVTCGSTCAPLTGDQPVATINFKTLTAGGPAAVSFTDGTVLLDASTNQDILGSLSATSGATYTVDTTPPTVSLSSPASGSTLAAGSTVNISASATDANSVTKVDVYIDGSLKTSLTTSPYNYSWNTSGLSLGDHTIQAKASDPFGNQGTSSTVTVDLTDQAAPSAPTNFSSSSKTTEIDLSWSASTDNIGVTVYKIKRDGSLIATVSPPALSYKDTGLTTGTSYSYSIQAYDAAGNASPAAALNATTQTVAVGDLNGDGTVNISDLSILLYYWQTNNAKADLNGSGTVDIFDLSILLSHWSN